LIVSLIWYGSLAAALILSVALFFNAKAEIGRLRRILDAEMERNRQTVRACETRLDSLSAQLAEVGARGGASAALASTPASLNVSKRGQVLRLHRAGKTSEQICESMAVPRTEVDLLIKVHQLMLEQI
jgi:hypothetical protein